MIEAKQGVIFMGNVPAARPSPRIEFGILKWYDGDTFTIRLDLEAKDSGGLPVTLTASDTAVIRFYNCCRIQVMEKSFTDLSGGYVSLEFDADTSNLFPAGRYSYDVIVTHGDVTTVVKNNKIFVE